MRDESRDEKITIFPAAAEIKPSLEYRATSPSLERGPPTDVNNGHDR
jgi:hypothetical protein